METTKKHSRCGICCEHRTITVLIDGPNPFGFCGSCDKGKVDDPK